MRRGHSLGACRSLRSLEVLAKHPLARLLMALGLLQQSACKALPWTGWLDLCQVRRSLTCTTLGQSTMRWMLQR